MKKKSNNFFVNLYFLFSAFLNVVNIKSHIPSKNHRHENQKWKTSVPILYDICVTRSCQQLAGNQKIHQIENLSSWLEGS